MERANLKLLYATAESYPTHRVDVRSLFGHYLPRQGVQSDLLAVTQQDETDLEPWPGGCAIVTRVSGGALKVRLQTFFYMLKMLVKLPVTEYACVQIRDMPVVASFALLMGKLRGFKVVYWMSYPIPEGQIHLARERGLSSGMMKFLYPFVSGYVGRFLQNAVVIRKVRHLFVQSDVMKQELIDKGVSADRLTPVPMAVDLEMLASYQPTPRLTELKGPVLVYLGILERVRGIETLFEMLQIVRELYPDTVLVLAGDTPDTDHRLALQARSEAMGLKEHVIWTGWLKTHEAWDYVRRGDIALSPYPRGALLDSASPTKVAEYMALGVPVVANDQPDQQYVLETSGAGVAVPYTAQNFAEQVLKLLQDDALRAKMAAAGPDWVRANRSYESLTPQVADVYRKILS